MNSPTRRLERHFEPGQVVATRGVLALLSVAEISGFLDRHVTGDWGDLDAHDTRANDRALKDGTRILSSYQLYRIPNKGCVSKVWIITEADRSLTTVLLPEEY